MADSPPLVVKKYGNRRLYDTEASRYITLEDLGKVIRAGRDVRVVDAKTGAEITKSVLIQIIAEQEKAYDLLPTVFLKRMIQLSDSQLRDSLHRYLTVSLDTFLQAQQEFEKRYRHMAGNLLNPLSWILPAPTEVAKESTASPPPAQADQPDPQPVEGPASADNAPGPQTEEQIKALQRQLDEIQSTLRDLKK